MARSVATPRVFWLGLLTAFLLVFPFLHSLPVASQFITEYRTFNATMFAVWLLVVLSMNLLTGYSGQISLGHAAVVLIGAYSTGIFFDQYGLPLGLAILLAGLLTGLIGGIVIGLPAVRLAGPYLAIATFSLIITLPQILKLNLIDGWTNGARGIRIEQISPPGFVDGFLDDAQWLYYTAMTTAVLMVIIAWFLIQSPIGRAFVAVRESEIASTAAGINVPFYKALAFAISSLYAGVAGGLFFMVQGFVSPESMGFFDSILFLVAVVIGGLGTILGSVFGALFLTFQAELISKLGSVIPEAQTLRGAIYGAILIVTMVAFPRGVAGFVQRLPGWISSGAWRSFGKGDFTAKRFQNVLSLLGMERLGRSKSNDDEHGS
ncbi:MAG: branched-chain amino acid ABC transporter permease [Dehalococcoidia bacterium]